MISGSKLNGVSQLCINAALVPHLESLKVQFELDLKKPFIDNGHNRYVSPGP